MSPRSRAGWSSTAALILLLGSSHGARAATLSPVFDTSVINRVHEMAPLGASGSVIAINATSSKNGPPVGDHSYLVLDGIYFAQADGSGLREVWAAEPGTALANLTATPDGAKLAWTLEGFGGGAETMNAASGATYPIGRGPGDAQIDGFVAGPRSLYAMFAEGSAIRRVSSRGRLSAVRWSGPRLSSVRYVRSAAGTQLAVCGTVASHRIGVGVVDLAAGTLVTSRFSLRPARRESPTCQVSEDGSTIATIGGGARARRLVAVRAGRKLTVRLPRGTLHVAKLSPSGRYALVGAGPDYENSFEEQRSAQLTRSAAIVDLDAGRVVPIRQVGAYAKHGKPFTSGDQVLWSPDESHIAIGPASGGVLVLASSDAAPAFIRSPGAPPGFAFSGDQAYPIAFSADGSQVVFTRIDKSGDITFDHPYAAPANATSPATYLLSSSMRSFQGVVRSADGTNTWVMPSSTCHTIYRQPLLRLQGGQLWDGPFASTVNPFA